MINGNNFNTPLPKINVLVTPLDWGLGHATRCIPIIKQLISQGCEVYIAASGNGYFLLKKEFPETVILRINSYSIRYSRKNTRLPFVLLFQSPAIFISIVKERIWLKRTIVKYDIKAIISDNRFGMYSTKIPTVYITHQLAIKTGNYLTDRIARKIHYFFIKKYTYCWVPDDAENGLAGALSHQKKLSRHIFYIGPLSRFTTEDGLTKKYDILISISGPEPQRTFFEKNILLQLKNNTLKVLLLRGLPQDSEDKIRDFGSVKIVNHLSGDELSTAFQQSGLIISRSGYTTVMDLIKLGKKAILVPTPGQTEQEYLANYLMQKHFFYCIPQEKFYFDLAVDTASKFNFINPSFSMHTYKNFVNEFVQSLKSGNFATQ